MKNLIIIFWSIILLTVNLFAGSPNTAEMLGYGPQDRVLIINADDFGMCHAENIATMDLLKSGGVTSATIMVPCGWYEEAASFCRENPDLDVGIHLTLTAEWNRYRWGSVADASLVPSLLNQSGYFYPGVVEVEENAKSAEVEIEFRAQIDKALKSGIQPTHIDNHMGSAYGLTRGNSFLNVLAKLSLEYGLPFRLPRNMSAERKAQLNTEQINLFEGIAQEWVDKGLVIPDYLVAVKHGKTYEQSRDAYLELFKSLEPGLTELYLHPARESDEIKAISSVWYQRDYDERFFGDPETRKILADLNIHVIGWKPLMELERKNTAK